jgi:hypothetical protein
MSVLLDTLNLFAVSVWLPMDSDSAPTIRSRSANSSGVRSVGGRKDSIFGGTSAFSVARDALGVGRSAIVRLIARAGAAGRLSELMGAGGQPPLRRRR